MTRLTTEEQTTAHIWAARIIADNEAFECGNSKAKKYPLIGEYDGEVMDMPTVAEKPLSKCTPTDLRIMMEAHRLVADHAKRMVKALELALAKVS